MARQATPDHTMAGAWEGQWLSDHNGHRGRLRCVVTLQSNELYQAWFHAQYTKWIFKFNFAYTVTLHTQRQEIPPEYHFHGQEDLGALAGGVYHYEGKASPAHFYATYRCKYDYGTFQMSRPLAPP